MQSLYSKTCAKQPLKNKDKTEIIMTNGSLMRVERIAECSHWSRTLLACIKPLLVLKTNLWLFWEWPFYTGFTVFPFFVVGAQKNTSHSDSSFENPQHMYGLVEE